MIQFFLEFREDEFWFSLSDSDIGMYLQGVNADGRFDCTIEEIDVSTCSNTRT